MDDHALTPPPLPPRRRTRHRSTDPQHLVVETITQHADSLLRVARRYTQHQADAEDAYQRALEIFVKSAHRLSAETAHKWLHTVVKHEAFAVREQRKRLVGVADDEALDALDDARHVASVEERSERFDELSRAAEALRRLKPQEATALVLKAQGLSYAEIAERQGWTYTKVNRCITEGRRSFLERYEGIVTGAECERWSGLLSAMADGEAAAREVLEVRPHLRNCPSCRALLAGMRRSRRQVAAVVPPALLGGVVAGGGPGAAAGTRLLDRLGELLAGAQDRVVGPVLRAQGALEAAGASKVVAVTAAAAALAGGGVAVERTAAGPAGARAGDRPATGAQRAPAAVAPAPAGVSLPASDPSGAAVVQRAPTRLRSRRPAGGRPAPRGEFEPGPGAAKEEFASEELGSPAAPASTAEPPPSFEASSPEPPTAPASAPAGPPRTTSGGGDAADEFGF